MRYATRSNDHVSRFGFAFLSVDAPAHSAGPHEEAHIVFMRTGRMRWGVDGEERETEPGDMIVTPGGVPHSYEVLDDEPSKIICVTAPPEIDSDPGHK